MANRLLCCEMLRTEAEQLLKQKNIEVQYVEAGLHADFKNWSLR
ncbi:hypothetical protein [Sporomusa termitida]|nr:hypothetical protein [Sporomusa termitida]